MRIFTIDIVCGDTKSMSEIIDRILRDNGIHEETLTVLAERLSPTDLQSLLLEVYARRAANLSSAKVLEQYQQNRFTLPSPNAPQILQEFDRLAFAAAVPRFTAVELSPVCPLGTISTVAPLSQNNAVSTSRNTEVVSDLTNVLALECAVRRRVQKAETVRLCASHRVVRTKQFAGPGAFAHFRLFGMCSAGRATADYGFETEELIAHVGYYLRLLSTLREAGFRIPEIHVQLMDFDGNYAKRFTDIIAVIQETTVAIPVAFSMERHPAHAYYDGVRFQVYAAGDSATTYQIADGGVTNWTQQLLNNKKERLVISGIGSERVCNLFA